MEQKKKIYSLVLESRSQVFLSTQMAESLEEAFDLARIEYTLLNPPNGPNPMDGAKIWLFTIKTISELLKIKKDEVKGLSKRIINNNKEEIKEEESIPNIPLNKNKLILQIIKNKDKELLKKNKKLFTKNEIKYINEMLNK